MSFVHLKIKKVRDGAIMPRYATPGSSGFDLHSCVDTPISLSPGAITLFPSGLAMEIRRGFEGQVRSRSGLSSKHGVQVVNAPGTIDSDYRGEVLIPLINLGPYPYVVQPGERVAQCVIAPVIQMQLVECDELGETSRGDKGFGSTGQLEMEYVG